MQIVRNPFVFIGMIALSAALILSLFSEFTSDTVKKNKEDDKKKNILLARFFEEAEDPNSKTISALSNPSDLMEIYDLEIQELLYNEDDGSAILDEVDFSKLVWKENKKDGSMYYFFKGGDSFKRYLPLFKVKGDDGGYIVPISGKGLWSTIKGFIYIVPENKGIYIVKGISFYEHGETPGLGGEIDVYDVKKRYVNKKIDINNKKTPEMVKAVSDKSYELEYISGATITSDGLNDFIASHVLGRYKTILLEVNWWTRYFQTQSIMRILSLNKF